MDPTCVAGDKVNIILNKRTIFRIKSLSYLRALTYNPQK